jgi:type I restriction enzyme S subunit
MTSLKHWEISPLSELVDVLDNLRVPVNSSERSKRPGSVPYYGATGQVGTIDKAIFNEELLILGEDGVQFFDPNKPKAYKISGPAWVNNHAHVLRPRKEKVLLTFLLHFLNQFNYVGYANGTTRLKLTQGAMNSIPVHLPSIDEQHRIVELLEDHLSRLDAALTDLKKAQKMCSSLLASSLKSIVESVPHVYRPLSEVVHKIEAGKSFTCLGRPAENHEWGVIKVSAMTWGEFLPTENKAVPLTYNPPPQHRINQGDILISRANTQKYVGAAVRVKSEPGKLLLSDKSLRIVPKSDCDASWLVAVLSSPITREAISRQATGNEDSMRNISQKNLLSVQIPVPINQDCQLKVVESLSLVESRIASNLQIIEQNLVRMSQFRRSLLNIAFSGQLAKEVASV